MESSRRFITIEMRSLARNKNVLVARCARMRVCTSDWQSYWRHILDLFMEFHSGTSDKAVIEDVFDMDSSLRMLKEDSQSREHPSRSTARSPLPREKKKKVSSSAGVVATPSLACR